MAKPNLMGMNLTELEGVVSSLRERPFRTRQLMRWIYEKGTEGFAQMTDISKGLKKRLEEVAYLEGMRLVKRANSRIDETIKFLFDLEDEERGETVLIRKAGRRTICLSTQVGCLLGCRFYATGKIVLRRNLKTVEIVGQVKDNPLHGWTGPPDGEVG